MCSLSPVWTIPYSTADEKLTPYSRVELNRLIDQGMHFTVSTMRTPADVRDVFSEVNPEASRHRYGRSRSVRYGGKQISDVL